MHKIQKVKYSFLGLSVLAGILPAAVFATNGLAPTGLGMEHRAMGGAATGNPLNSSSLASNPAAASFVDDGYDVGLELFRPDRSATFNGTAFGAPGDATFDGNGKQNFLIPEASYKQSTKSGLDMGITAYGNGGMNTEYTNNPGFGAGIGGVDYQQLFVAPTLSYKLNPEHAIGVSLNFVYHKFRADGLQGFDNAMFSASPGHVTNNGYDSSTGVGASIGWQGRLAPHLTAGVAYRSKTKMGKFDKYAGLFENGGEFSVPAAISAGFGWQLSPETTVAMDIQRIQYSDVGAIGNSSHIQAPFGASGGPGFGWDDITVYKLGVKHQLNPTVALMAGYNYGGNPVKSSETTVNVLAPGITQKHLSLGAEIGVSPKSSVILSYVHAFAATVQGDNTVPPPGPIPLDGYDLNMKQDAIGIAYSHQF